MPRTIQDTVEHEIIINKSRFIGILIPLNHVDEVNAYLEYYREIYPEATHYCFSYVIGPLEKANDNGEPSGTAGLPMLNVIKKNELENILAIVIRYFGGIKLGAGGLVRAYTQAVVEALNQAKIVTKVLTPYYAISFDYPLIGQMDYLLKKNDISVVKKTFDEKVTYECFIQDENIFSKIQDLTSNHYTKTKLKEAYIEMKEEI